MVESLRMARENDTIRISLDLSPDINKAVEDAAGRVGLNKRSWITQCILRCLGRDPLGIEPVEP